MANKISLSAKKGQLSKKDGQEKILAYFYDHPESSLTVRELASKLKLSRSSVQQHLVSLRKKGILSPENRWIDSWENRYWKSQYHIGLIVRSGLVDHLEEQLAASAVIVFGSIQKGESVEGSDIDIFAECAREKKLDLSGYEKKLSRKIQLFTKPKITLLPKHLLNNVVNGIKLKGYFTIK